MKRSKIFFGVSILISFAMIIAVLYFEQNIRAAGSLEITTTAIDEGQVNQPYFYKMQTNGDIDMISGDDGADSWQFVTPTNAEMLTNYGLSIDFHDGYITGTSIKSVLNLPVTISCEIDSGGEFSPDQKTYYLTIAGILRFDSGPHNPTDSTVMKGQSRVPAIQLQVQAIGENIEISRLKFYGLGTGSDSNDIKEVNVFLDLDNNGAVSPGEVPLIPAVTYSTEEGFLNSVVTMSFGSNILRIDSSVNNGIRNILITYDFYPTVEANRTFRIAFEKPTDIDYTTLTTSKTYSGALGGGNPYTSNNQMTVEWKPNSADYPPYKGGIITISGDTPSVPTLFMANGGISSESIYVRAGDETMTLPFFCWADTSHTIRLEKVIITDSGSGDAASHLEYAKIYLDIDKSGTLNSGDPEIVTGSIVGDQITFSGINRNVTTPSGLFTDAGTLYFLIAYKFKTTVPILTPPLTFQAYLPSATCVTAKEISFNTTVEVKPDTPSLYGNLLAVNQGVDTSSSGGTTSGPYPIKAQWFDVDTNHVPSQGDTILLTFDTNLSQAVATADNFLLPVLGDALGAGATFGQAAASNGMKITLGVQPIIQVSGTYVNGTHTYGSPSGINVKDTLAVGIVSIYGLTAGPAVNTVDVESAPVSYSSSSSGSSGSDTGTSSSSSVIGDKACLISRTFNENIFFTYLRIFRDFALENNFCRKLIQLYYAL